MSSYAPHKKLSKFAVICKRSTNLSSNFVRSRHRRKQFWKALLPLIRTFLQMAIEWRIYDTFFKGEVAMANFHVKRCPLHSKDVVSFSGVCDVCKMENGRGSPLITVLQQCNRDSKLQFMQ